MLNNLSSWPRNKVQVNFQQKKTKKLGVQNYTAFVSNIGKILLK